MADEKQEAAPEQDGLSVKEAAKSIEDLLSDNDVDEIVNGSATDDDEDTQTSPAAKKSSKKKKEEEPDPDEDEDDEPSDDEDDEEVEASDDDEDEEVDETPAPKGKLHRVKADGEDFEVEYKELLAGYSRTSSFTKKSQALAEKQRAFDAATFAKQAEITQAQEHYVAQLSAMEEALASDEPDWESVRQNNPEHFAELHAAWQIHERRLDTIRKEREKEEGNIAATRLAAHGEYIKSERAKLVEAVPEWGDKTEKGTAFRRALHAFGTEQGYSAQELEAAGDHRAFKLLHKAYLYDKSLAEKASNKEKGKKKVDAIGQIKPGAKPTASKSRKSVQRQKDSARLRKTGNVRDAASIIESMLG